MIGIDGILPFSPGRCNVKMALKKKKRKFVTRYNPATGKKEKYADEQTFIRINIVTRGCLLCRA